MSINLEAINSPEFKAAADQTKQWLDTAQQAETEQVQREETDQAETTQLAAEQEDPRNKEQWGLDGVVKELQSSFVGGLQDTASSAVTLAERGLDMATGEMQEEMSDGGKYTAEWDDWFVDDSNPIETKTWWGGLIRSATHFGSTAAGIVVGAKALGVSAVGAGAAGVVSKLPGGAAALRTGGAFLANQWGRAAAVGGATDLVSKYSQDANGLQILRDRYGFIDTPLTTNDADHPTVKTLKNVVEGLGIGTVADGMFYALGRGTKQLPDILSKTKARAKSVKDQIVQKAKVELAETPTEFRGHKNEPIADPWQGAPTSTESAFDVRESQKKIRQDLGSEEGSPGSVTTPVQLEVAARTNGLSEEVVTEVYKGLSSDARFQAEVDAIQQAGSTMKEEWGDAIEQWQRTGLGREASDLSPEEYLAEYFEGAHRYFEDTPDEMVAWSAKNIVAGDLLVGSLLREIRDLGISGRELADLTDLGSVDGPAKALFDKLITTLTEVKRAKILQSEDYLNAGAGKTAKGAKGAHKKLLNQRLETEVGESIEGFRLALRVAGESDNDDLFKAIFETVSMSNDIHNLTDFDNWVRTKLKGGDFKGKANQSVLIKELQGVMVNSILSGPKTPARAIMGTSTATFLRPISQTVGAAIRLPFTGDTATLRASMASVNAMRQALPEAWQLFKTRLNSYWAGDIATVRSRYSEYTRGDEQWDMMGHWVENSGKATAGDKAAYYAAHMSRQLNNNKFLTYSPKIMAATDDTFGYILSRARAKEKAVREALENGSKGDWTEINSNVLQDAENRFLAGMTDAKGNILDDSVNFAKREVTLTEDLSGFAKGLNKVFEATPWAKPFFLFARTGVNGLTLTAKHTPGFNFLVKEFNDIARATPDTIADVAKYGINSAEDLANAKALQQGRLAIGTAVISMGAAHFMDGNLTGNGPTDRSKRQVWLDAGWQPRSIKIGGVWVGYDSMEPFNQVLSTIADIGDHSQLMGEEWTQDNFQKLSLMLASSVASKTYLQGLQQFVDLFSGQPGKQNRIIGSLLNNTLPLAGLRNDIGKLINPHMKELGSSVGDSVRNRNLISEYAAGEPLPTKYDMLNGKPVKDHDFVTRMYNMFSPIPLNLDQSPGRKLLFESGYDLRVSTYYGPDGTDLTQSPRLRSLYQKAIGDQNIELKLDKLANDPKIQASIDQMQEDLRMGLRDKNPMKAYYHNRVINKIFTKARKIAWAKLKKNDEIKELIDTERSRKLADKKSLRKTGGIKEILSIPK